MEETTLDKIYIQAAIEANAKFAHGDVITKEWLLSAFRMVEPLEGTKQQFQNYAFELMQNMSGFVDAMLFDYKKALSNVRGVGYRVVTPKQQTKMAMDNLKTGIKKEIEKAVDLLCNIEESYLSSEDIKSRDEAQMKVSAMMAFNMKRIS